MVQLGAVLRIKALLEVQSHVILASSSKLAGCSQHFVPLEPRGQRPILCHPVLSTPWQFAPSRQAGKSLLLFLASKVSLINPNPCRIIPLLTDSK